MNSIRKWLYKPKKTDQSLLAQFFYADEDLNGVTSELDSFDGRKDPDRCTALVNHLRQCQDKVLNICQMLMDEVISEDRAPRDFRAKFPDDVLQENLAGQLWFGAECLAAGSSILNREVESTTMRPLAKAFTKSLENVRNLLREQCFRNPPEFTEKICESLKILDRLFAEFELSYVSAMVPVKTVHEYEAQQAITVLFSETFQRALRLGLLCQEQVDSYDPAVMFTIPRLAILAGLLIYPDGPLCLDHGELSEMFRPFRSLLLKIRELLWTLSRSELSALERSLCSSEEPDPESADLNESFSPAVDHGTSHSPVHQKADYETPNGTFQITNGQTHSIQYYLDQFCIEFPQCKELISTTTTNSESRRVEPIEDLTHSEYIPSDGEESSSVPRQRIVNAVTIVNHTNNTMTTSWYIEHGEGDGNCSSSTSVESDGIEEFDHSEHEKELQKELETKKCLLRSIQLSQESNRDLIYERNPHPTECYNQRSENGERMTSYSSFEDEIPTSNDIEQEHFSLEGDVVIPKSQTSSSSSHDSGLCSMADNSKVVSPSTESVITNSGITFDFPTTSESLREALLPVSNSSSSTLDKTLLHVPDSYEQRQQRKRRSHTRSQQVSGRLDSGDIEFRGSHGDESACDTSSFDSECQDDIEIALAMQAAEIATRTEARSRFKNSADLIHRLFICISGVADQLQTNYAADLRSTLKCVFAINATPGEGECDDGETSSTPGQDTTPEPSLDEEIHDSETSEQHYHVETSQSTEVISPPSWVPDELAPQCMSCLVSFTVVRRRHHCRACGKVFCGKCSGNSVPLPRFGYGMKPQRVCNSCFVYRVTPFTLPSEQN